MEILVLSSLEKVFSDERPSAEVFKGFSMLKNERSSFQVAFCNDKDEKVNFELNGSLAEYSTAYTVREIPVGTAAYKDNTDDFYLRKTSGNYPDCLMPVNGDFNAQAGKWYSLWIEVIPKGNCIGKSVISVSVNGEKAEVEIEVIDAELPEQELIYTNWYHSDCICNYYNIESTVISSKLPLNTE